MQLIYKKFCLELWLTYCAEVDRIWVAGFSAGFDVSMEYTAMASNNKKTGKTANKKTGKPANNNAAVNSVVQSEAISELTSIVRSLMQEISQLKAKVNSEITVPANKTVLPESISELLEDTVNSEIKTVPANKTPVVTNKKDHTVVTNKTTVVAPSANKTPVVPNKKDHIVMPKVNVVPANKFVLLAENEAVNEIVTISAIGSPFWGKGFGGRSCMKQAVNCVTKSGNTMVVFMLLNRDALGNTIPSGLVGGKDYVINAVASGKTWEFNNEKTNIVNKVRFSPVS
jgi:hypothetical protein